MNINESARRPGLPGGKRDWLKQMGAALALAPALALGLAASGPARAAAAGPRAGYFPNVRVTTHEGRELRFYDDLVRGRTVLFNMMYSVCAGICPANTANLLQVQQALGSRMGKDIFMVSMTLQPELDTPDALREYVGRYGIQPGWTFLTGPPREMQTLRRKLGFFDRNPALDSDLANHTGMVRIGNEALDRWMMMPALSPPRQIARAALQM